MSSGVSEIMNASGNGAKSNMEFFFIIGQPVKRFDALPIILK